MVLSRFQFLMSLIAFVFSFYAMPVDAASELPMLQLYPGENSADVRDFVRYKVGDIETLDGPTIRGLIPELKSVTASNIQFGPARDKILVLLRVRNAGSEAGHWIFSSGRGSLLYIRLFELSNGTYVEHLDGSDKAAVKHNLQKYHDLAFEFSLAPGEERILGLHLEAENSTNTPIVIQTEHGFYRGVLIQTVVMTIAGTGMLILIAFNGLLYVMTGRRVFLLVVVAEAAYLLQSLHITGFSTIFLFYDNPGLARTLAEGCKCVFVLSLSQFARSFLHTRERWPGYDKILQALIALAILLLLLLALRPIWPPDVMRNLHYSAWALTGVSCFFMPVLGVMAVRSYGRIYLPLVISWGSMGLFLTHTALTSAGLVRGLPYHWHWVGPVGLFEGLFLTLSMCFYVKEMQLKALDDQQKLSDSLLERLRIAEKSEKLAREKATVVASLDEQSSLLHAAGHDSKQVLYALRTLTRVLEKDAGQVDPEMIVDMLRSSSQHLGHIVSTTMASPIGAAYSVDFLALSHGTLNDVLQPLRMIYDPQAREKGLTLDLTGDRDRPLVTDFALLSRALSNLISNAIKFTNTGTIRISVDGSADGIKIAVADQGCGMKPETVRQLRDGGGQRVREQEKIDGTGTGFKAAAVIANRLDAALELVSDAGRGTTVTMTLPDPGQTATATASGSGDVDLLDIDSLSTAERVREIESIRASTPDGRLVIVTHDKSIGTREWASQYADLLLYKPLQQAAFQHPAYCRLQKTAATVE